MCDVRRFVSFASWERLNAVVEDLALIAATGEAEDAESKRKNGKAEHL